MPYAVCYAVVLCVSVCLVRTCAIALSPPRKNTNKKTKRREENTFRVRRIVFSIQVSHVFSFYYYHFWSLCSRVTAECTLHRWNGESVKRFFSADLPRNNFLFASVSRTRLSSLADGFTQYTQHTTRWQRGCGDVHTSHTTIESFYICFWYLVAIAHRKKGSREF